MSTLSPPPLPPRTPSGTVISASGSPGPSEPGRRLPPPLPARAEAKDGPAVVLLEEKRLVEAMSNDELGVLMRRFDKVSKPDRMFRGEERVGQTGRMDERAHPLVVMFSLHPHRVLAPSLRCWDLRLGLWLTSFGNMIVPASESCARHPDGPASDLVPSAVARPAGVPGRALHPRQATIKPRALLRDRRRWNDAVRQGDHASQIVGGEEQDGSVLGGESLLPVSCGPPRSVFCF
jgi:hypothetical protein